MMKKRNIRKLQILIHNIGCMVFISVGILGIVRLISYLLYGCSPEMNVIIYMSFTIIEIAIGIFGLIELKKKYLLKK